MIAIGLSLCLSYSIYHEAISAYETGEEFFYHEAEGNIAAFEWISFTNPETGERTPWRLGFWIDSLTAIMLMVVSIVSLRRSPLLARVHERGGELQPLLRIPRHLLFFDAPTGSHRQLVRFVYLLGIGGSLLVPLDRFLHQ